MLACMARAEDQLRDAKSKRRAVGGEPEIDEVVEDDDEDGRPLLRGGGQGANLSGKGAPDKGEAPPGDVGIEEAAESDGGTMPPPATAQCIQEGATAAAEAATKGAVAAGAAQR